MWDAKNTDDTLAKFSSNFLDNIQKFSKINKQRENNYIEMKIAMN